MNKKERIERLEKSIRTLRIDLQETRINLSLVQKRLSYITGPHCLDIEWGEVDADWLHTSRTIKRVLENTDKAISVLDKTTISHRALAKENAQLYEMLMAISEHLGVKIVRTAPEPAQFVVEEADE